MYMVELTEVIKTSKPVKTDLENIKEKDKHSSLDSVIRNTLERNGRLEAENKNLRTDLRECRNKNRRLKIALKKLDEMKKEEQEN